MRIQRQPHSGKEFGFVLKRGKTIISGSGHGSIPHRNAIDAKISELESTRNYSNIYGNRSLNTAGLQGSQRPDIIAKTWDGTYEVWEYASASQASGYGYNQLCKKMEIMQAAIFHEIIPWEG